MMTREELLNKMSDQNLIERARLWNSLLHADYSSPFQRIAARTEAFGLGYLWGSLIHYLTECFPWVGRIPVPSRTFWGQRILIEMRIADQFRPITRGVPSEIQEVRLTQYIIAGLALSEKDVFYDIGANIGFYSMLAAELSAEVHAFEPIKDTYRLLQMNLRYYDQAYTVNAALSDSQGNVVLYRPIDWSGLSTMVPEMLLKPYQPYNVNATTLDSYVLDQRHSPPTVLKIDVEGAEIFVLKGGERTIAQYQPTILVELSPPHRYGLNNSLPVIEFLRQKGYVLHRIDDNGSLLPVTIDAYRYLASIVGDFDNVVFIPRKTI
jgi:FkbM family methyltransferase